MAEVKGMGRERTALRGLAHRVYDEMVVEQEAAKVNRLENFAQAIIIVTIIGVAALGFAAIESSGFEALIKERLKSAAPIAINAIRIALGLLALGALVTAINLTSGRTYRLAGRFVVYLRRRLLVPREGRSRNLEFVSYWLRSDPRWIAGKAEQLFGGRSIEKALPETVRAPLERLRDQGAEDPVLILRSLLERKYKALYIASWFRTPRPGEPRGGAGASYFALAREYRNAIKVSMLLDVLGADLRGEFQADPLWNREYFTQSGKQQMPLWDDHDLPLRLRTFAPHLKAPNPSEASSDGEAPIYLAIATIENPLEQPVFILKLKDAIAAMPEAVVSFEEMTEASEPGDAASNRRLAAQAVRTLATTPVKMVGKRDHQNLRPSGGRNVSDAPLLELLSREARPADPAADPESWLAADWGVRWDPNRINFAALDPVSNAEVMRALALFIEALDIAARRTEQRIVVRRGDVLIMDNRRALLRRREQDFYTDPKPMKLLLRMPPHWWLRGFYGFRRSNVPGQAAAAPSVRGARRFAGREPEDRLLLEGPKPAPVRMDA